MAPPSLANTSLIGPQRKREAKQDDKLALAVKQMLNSNPELAKRARKEAQIDEKANQSLARLEPQEAVQNLVQNARKLIDETMVE